jgi:hypothetical protein
LGQCVENDQTPAGYRQLPDVERLVILEGLRRRETALEQAAFGAKWTCRRGDQKLHARELCKLKQTMQEFSKPRVLIKC